MIEIFGKPFWFVLGFGIGASLFSALGIILARHIIFKEFQKFKKEQNFRPSPFLELHKLTDNEVRLFTLRFLKEMSKRTGTPIDKIGRDAVTTEKIKAV